ncbi:helix-turn-helix transcriptional regulator [Paenibacillus radicis (ex Gao et al. 2016)]|uniref:AraC family transcriptional regulator n=1 Tax=Paenibacillus radicis (ex Gao et al. 2016) TaxID=1737354 RepID=A0A917LYB4_9BACL|nr:AraC family transcriptional regulator [Paenibacillus radicis (ex Gao et al. 2016)]GGG63723.1 AraC family transcriptional regulator [Paenibacillus radicis (ex Gao et al. 2016)]
MMDYGYRSEGPIEPIFHSHTNYEVYYFHEGQCNYLIGDNIFHMAPGDLIIMYGMTLHCAKIDPSYPYVRSIIHFDPGIVRPYAELPHGVNLLEPFEQLKNYRLRLRGEDKAEVERILELMRVYQLREDAIGENRFRLAFVDLLYFIFGLCALPLKERQEYSSDKEASVQRIISLLEQSYKDDLHMEQLEAQLHMSKSYLSKLFKEVTGVTIFHYIYRRRINEAKIMFLMEPELSVTEVAFRLGFKHLAHFSRLFKQFAGITPEQFKRGNGEVRAVE